MLFGDGAGAVVVSAAGRRRWRDPRFRARDRRQRRAGAVHAGRRQPAAAVARDDRQRLHYVKQDGQTVFKFAVRKTEEIARRVLERNGLTPDDLDLFVSHQANRRIIQSATEKLGVDPDKVIINIERFGNTTAATIPLALNDAVCSGPAEEGRPGAARVGRRRVHRRRGAAALGVLNGTLRVSLCTGKSAIVPAVAGQLRRQARASRCCRRTAGSRSPSSCVRRQGASSATLFSFVSGLYFRGKLTYARRFAAPPEPDSPTSASGMHIITPNAGLREPRHAASRSSAMQAFADADVDPTNAALSAAARAERPRAGRRDRPRLRRRAARQHRLAEVRRRAARRSSASGCGFRSTSSDAAT